MADAPRRSLRLRNTNIPHKPPENKMKGPGTKRRSTSGNTVESSPKIARSLKDKEEEVEAEKKIVDKNEVMSKSTKVSVKSAATSRKQQKTVADEEEEKVEKSDRDTVESIHKEKKQTKPRSAKISKKSDTSAKKQQISKETEEEDKMVDDESPNLNDLPNNTTSSRPKRGCTLKRKTKVTVESTEDDSDSDEYEEESEIPKNRKITKGKGKNSETSSDDNSIHEEKEEEQKPSKVVNKRSVTRKTKAATVPDVVTKKKRSTVPTRHVDEEELITWEKKAKAMKKKFRDKEKVANMSTPKMGKVKAFVEGLLKGRITEMDERESIKELQKLAAQFAEEKRRARLGIVDRLREDVAKGGMEEDEHANDESDEEDEWEDVEPIEDAVTSSHSKPKTLSVLVDHPVKGEADWRSRWLRTEVNREVRHRRYVQHKVHLLCYASHLRHLASLSISTSSILLGKVLSIIPWALEDMNWDEIFEWFMAQFTEGFDGNESEEKRLEYLVEKRMKGNEKETAMLFFSTARAAGKLARLVMACDVMSKKLPLAEKEKNTKGKEKTKMSKEEDRNRLYWCEIWDKINEKWIAVDPVTGTYSDPSSISISQSCLYVLAIDSEFGIRDVTARYVSHSLFVSRDFRMKRADVEWMEDTWTAEAFSCNNHRSLMEDKEWEKMLMEEPLATTVIAFKDHPLYVLDKDVLKAQAIYPEDTLPIGEIKGYKIYPRSAVHPIETENWYQKLGRQIREGEEPTKEKNVTNPFTGMKYTNGLYGYWQTDQWDGGEVKDGVVPRNEFDNVYMYQPEMCPKGGIHLTPQGLMQTASDMGLDYAQAVVGWQFKGGNIIPILSGAVYAKDDLPQLIPAWKNYEKERREEEKKRRSEKAIENWTRFIRGSLRLHSMRCRFAPILEMGKKKENEKKVEVETGKNEEKEAEQVSWPPRSYGAEMFEF